MKKRPTKVIIGLIAIMAIWLTSCSEKKLNQDDIVKKNAEEYLKSKMNNPDSYEFVKLELIDSVLFSDNIKFRKNRFSELLETDQGNLHYKESLKTELPSLYDKQEIEDLKVSIEKNKRILVKIDSLEKQLGKRNNEVASYTYVFSFRGNNSLGVKVLNEYIIQTDSSPNFKIINVADEKKKIFLNPNDFPGYKEMIKKNL
jgi:hypothetical protein